MVDNNEMKHSYDANSIHIVSLSIPSASPNLANSKEFEGITVERNKTNTIEIIFSEEIADDDYTL